VRVYPAPNPLTGWAARVLETGHHVGDTMLNGLKAPDRHPERHTTTGVFDGRPNQLVERDEPVCRRGGNANCSFFRRILRQRAGCARGFKHVGLP
jgi:hypothetical protein